MARIAISYRRSDTQDITGRIFDRLAQQYGRKTVFRDIDSIQPGMDFRAQIASALEVTDVLLVVVGPRWLGRSRGAESRIDNESDPVRIEVEMALKRDIPIIPVLVGGTTMPDVGHLPATLQDFAFRHAVKVDGGRDFDHHIDDLIRTLDQILSLKGIAPAGREDDAAVRDDTIASAPALARTKSAASGVGVKAATQRRFWSSPLFYGVCGGLLGILLTAALVFPRGGRPPSFDCFGASEPDEKEICRNRELAELDRNLAEAYSVLRAHLEKDRQDALAADEQTWLEKRKACNANDDCLRAAYMARLRQLKSWK